MGFGMYKRILGLFFWEGMKGQIKKYVYGCKICQKKVLEILYR